MLLASLVSLVLTIVLLPAIVLHLPADYFVRDRRQPVYQKKGHPVLRGAVNLFKNLLGLLFIVAGILMLVLPGQGLITILVGLVIANFPGKYRLEQILLRQPVISRTLARLRKKAHRQPFQMPPENQ